MLNLLTNLPISLPEELVEIVAEGEHVRIERIVSHGHSSPPGFWYDQEQNEWVVVLAGEAKLLIEGNGEALTLSGGDHLFIPAHQKHRVEWTTPEKPTIWLAVFFD